MADNGSEDLQIVVGGDTTPLQQALDQIPQVAQDAAARISAALGGASAPVDALAGAANNAAAGIANAGAAAASANQPVDAFGEAMRRITEEFQNQQRAAQDAAANLQMVQAAYAEGTASAGQLEAAFQKLEAAERSITGTTQTMQQQLQDLSMDLLKTGAAVSAISLPLIGLGTSAIKTAADFESTEAVFSHFLGSATAGKKLLEDVINFAIKTPFQIPGLEEAATKLLAVGVDAQKIIPILTSLGDAAAGAGKGEAGLSRLVDLFQKLTTSALVTNREIMQFSVNGINAIQILADHWGVSIGEMRKDISAGLVQTADAIPVLLAGITAKFGGQMQVLSEQTKGQWNNIQDQITKTLKAIGDQLLPFVKQVEDMIRKILDVVQSAAEAFGQLPEPVKNFTIALAAAAAVAGPLLVVLGGLTLALSAVSVPLLAITAGAVGAVAAIAGIATALSSITIPAGLKDFLGDVVKFVEIAAAFGAAAAAVTAGMNLLILAIEGVSAALAAMSISGVVAGFEAFTAVIGTTITQLVLMSEAAWTANTALGSMVSAVTLVAGAFVGWEIGTMLRNNVEWIRNMGDAIADLLMKTPGVNRLLEALTGISSANRQVAAANDSLTASIEKLKTSLAAHNIVIQQGSMSNEEYSRTLRTAAAALSDINEPAASYQKTVTQLGIEHQKLQDALRAARQELTNVTAAFKNGLANQADLTAATEKYRAALAAANPELTKTGVIIDANSRQLANWNKNWDLAAQKAIDAYKAIASGEKTPEQAVSALGNAIENASLNIDKMSGKSKALLTELQADFKAAQQAAAQAQINQELDKMEASISSLELKAAQMADNVPLDFQEMISRISSGENFNNVAKNLETQIQNLQSKLRELSSSDIANGVGGGIQAVIDKLVEARDRATELNEAFKLVGQDAGMDRLATQITALTNLFNNGEVTAAQFQAGLNKIGGELTKNVIPAMEQGVDISPKLIAALSSLPGIADQLADAAKRGPDAFAKAIADMTEQIRADALTVNNALKDLGVTSFDALRQTVVKANNDIVAAFQGITDAAALTAAQLLVDQDAVVAWGNKVIPVMIQTGQAIQQSVLDQLAKISPAVAQAAKEGPDALRIAIDQLAVQTKIDTLTMSQAYQQFGLTSQAAMQNTLALEQASLQKLIETRAPLTDIVAGQLKILQTQMQIATATDMTGESELALAQKITAVQAAQFVQHTQAMAQAEEWNVAVKAITTAWTDLGKGLADAIVSGQNFGQVFTKVLDDLKKKIVEDIVNTAFKQLGAAILQNSTWLSGLNDSLKLIPQTAAVTQKAVSASLSAATDAVDTFGDATVTTMGKAADATKSAASSMVSSLGSLINSLGVVSQIVTAIASVIADFQLAHISKLLGEIEVTTRQMANILGLNGAESILGYTHATANLLTSIQAMLWNPIVSLLTTISGNSDTMVYDLDLMRESLANLQKGIVTSGGGSSSTVNPLTFSSDFLNQGNQMVQVSAEASTALSAFAAATTDTTTALSNAADTISAVVNGVNGTANPVAGVGLAPQATTAAQAVQAAVTPNGVGIDASTVVITPTQPFQFGGAPGTGNPVAGIGLANDPTKSAQMQAAANSMVLNVNVSAGNVVGNGGITQFANQISDIVVQGLRRQAGLLKM